MESSLVNNNGWLLLLPFVGAIVVSLKSAFIYRLHGTRFTYWTGGYIFDSRRPIASKLLLFVANVVAGYLIVLILLLISDDL